jgi:hypothetical protein
MEKELNVILWTYALSTLLTIIGFFLVIATIRTRKRVLEKHISDMAILEDWDRAIRYAYSGNEAEILIALDIIWALSNPVTYAEVQPIVSLFQNHANQNISIRAQRIVDKQMSWFAQATTA